MATLYTAYSSTGDYTKTRVKIDYTPGQTTATATLLYTRTNNYTGATSATNCTFKFGGVSKTFSKSFTGKQTDATVTSLTFTISTAGGTYSGSSNGVYLGGSWSITIPAATFTATFGANGGLAPSASSVTFTAGTAIGTLPTIQRIGYTFLGWYGGARQTITLSSSTSNYNYQAILTGVKAGTSYGINIATASLTSGSATEFTTLIYDFTDSKQLAASVQTFGSNKRYMIDCPSSADSSHDIRIIVYAGISGSTANQAATYSNVSVGPKLTSSTVMPAANTYYYAFWQKNNYTITYNANGGTVSSTTQTVTYGNTASLTTPTRAGYTFKGWYVNFTGSNAVNIGRIYNFTSKLSFHLEAYSSNWGNLTNDGQRLISCTESGGFNIESNGGYIQFSGYDSGVGYVTLKTSKTWASLSAGWHSFDYVFNGSTITGYVDDVSLGTSAAFSSGKIGYNASNTLWLGAEAGPDTSGPAGAYFVGRIKSFQISDSNTKLTGTANKFRMPAQNITMVAEWEANTYTAVVDPNGGYRVSDGKTDPHSFSIKCGASDNITERARAGYTLTGYVIKNTASGSTTDIGGATITFDSSTKTATFVQGSVGVTLVAQWKANTYTITFNPNGGSLKNPGGNLNNGTNTNSVTVTYGTNAYYGMAGDIPTRTGYNFTGWYTAASGGTKVYDSSGICVEGTYWKNQLWSYAGNLTVYAQWTPKIYTISYNGNGNIVSGVPSSQTKTHGTNIALSSTKPTRTRYTFSKWNTKADGSGTSYNPGATFSTEATTTLYAIWTINDKDIYLYNTGKIDAVDFKTVSTVTELFDKNGYVYGTGFVTHSESNIYIGKDGKIYAKEFIKY